jgi:hypothetical protein
MNEIKYETVQKEIQITTNKESMYQMLERLEYERVGETEQDRFKYLKTVYPEATIDVNSFCEEYYRKNPNGFFDEAIIMWKEACGIIKKSKTYTVEESRQALAVSLVKDSKSELKPKTNNIPTHPKPITYHSDPVDEVFKIVERERWNENTDRKVMVMGLLQPITKPFYIDKWAAYDISEFPRSIPPEGLKRLKIIRDAGIKINGVVILDDPRKHPIPSNLLEPPPLRRRVNLPHPDWHALGAALKLLFITAGVITGGVLLIMYWKIILAVLAGLAISAVALFILGVVADPELCIITEGNNLVCIYSWDD